MAALSGILLAGLLLRVWLLPTPGHRDDIDCFTSWANILRQVGPGEFYAHDAPESEYLPGYLYLLAATAFVRSLFVGAPAEPDRFALWIKLAPIAADLVLGATVFLLCRRFLEPKRSLVATALVVFNPGVVFVSAVWGQVDTLGATLATMSLTALISGLPILAAILAGSAFLTKPQYCLFLAVAGLAYLRSDLLRLPPLKSASTRSAWTRWSISRVLLPIAALIGTVEALLIPFSISLWPTEGIEWTLLDRLTIATTKFPVTSASSFNLWATPIAGMWLPDSSLGWLSMSYQTWGWLLLALVVAVTLVAVWHRPNDLTTVVWGCAVLAIAFFVLPTRMHQRYLFAAMPLLATAAVLNRWMLLVYLGASALYISNLWTVYSSQFSGQPKLEVLGLGSLIPVVSAFSVALLVAALLGLVSLVILDRGKATALSGLWSRRSLIAPNGHPVPTTSNGVCAPRRKAALAVSLTGLVLIATFAAGLQLGRAGDARAKGVHTVDVRSYKLWQDSGVEVTEGQQLYIAGRGDWTNKRGGERFGPGGSWRVVGGTIMPEVPIGVLLGRIGDSPPFVVGERAMVTAPTSGRLQLVMNDWPDDRQDAQGSVQATVVLLTP